VCPAAVSCTTAEDSLDLLLAHSVEVVRHRELPRHETKQPYRNDLLIEETNVIATVGLRAQMLPEPLRGKITLCLSQYVDARLDFDRAEADEQAMLRSVEHAEKVQIEMLEETAAAVQQSPNSITSLTSLFVQSLDGMRDLIEQRLAAEQKRIPSRYRKSTRHVVDHQTRNNDRYRWSA
jgi:hypothetical protein